MCGIKNGFWRCW